MKTVRILFSITLFSFIALSGYSQGLASASPECQRSVSFYNDYMKQGNYAEAAPLWRDAFKYCPPGIRQGIYVDGQKIFKYFIEKNKTNPNVKNALIDSLFMMFDLRVQHFPTHAASAATFKVYDVLEYMGDNDEKVMEAVNNAIEVSGLAVEPGILVIAMDRTTKMFAKEKLDAEKVLETYSKLTPIIDGLIAAKKPDAEQAKKDIDNLFAVSGVASCKNIVDLFTPRFNANPTDKALISTIVKLLSDGECTSEELFLKSVQALHSLEPSFQSAYYLYKLHAANNDHANAIKLLLEAIESDQSTDEQDASMLIELSNYYMQKMENILKAAEYARLAMQKSSAVSGRANLIIGLVWGSLRCTGNDVETRAKYWVAVDYLIRARNADPSLAEEANRYISSYSQYFPAQEESFMYDIIDGASYTVSCGGMRESTTVRTRK